MRRRSIFVFVFPPFTSEDRAVISQRTAAALLAIVKALQRATLTSEGTLQDDALRGSRITAGGADPSKVEIRHF